MEVVNRLPRFVCVQNSQHNVTECKVIGGRSDHGGAYQLYGGDNAQSVRAAGHRKLCMCSAGLND